MKLWAKSWPLELLELELLELELLELELLELVIGLTRRQGPLTHASEEGGVNALQRQGGVAQRMT